MYGFYIVVCVFLFYFFFVFNDTASTEIYTRSLVAASDVYKRQIEHLRTWFRGEERRLEQSFLVDKIATYRTVSDLSLIHISEPTRPY